MYTLTSIARRSTTLGVAVALLAATILPSAVAFADALNPLTDRSLLLSSSAPGFQDTDGAGNSETSPNAIGENYAPAGSGPNGKKSGETFSFKVSSDSSAGRDIRGFTLQYCTSAAGKCQAPGDNTGDERDSDRETNATAHPLGRSDLDVVGSWTNGAGAGQFQVLVDGTPSTGWTMSTSNVETQDHSDELTGKNNFITLVNSGPSGAQPESGSQLQIIFKASTNNYITNPGSGAFFVKMNTYDTATTGDHVPGGSHNIDGGVTVANVMTDSIHITTKVLETMSFSVGTENPDKLNVQHGICDNIQVVNNNRLNLGDQDAEYSLSTAEAHEVFSYWRLSSNSSGGATVYYSGDTLQNTVGDDVDEMGTEKNSQPGTEQFGLALVDAGLDTMDTLHPGGFPATHITPNIDPLNIGAAYDEGDTASISSATTANNAKFAFFGSSLTSPEVIAENSDDVIRCATSKVRYVANIAADTPAGVYTTKINYLAAPQY